jgi:UDP-N-acetylmuramoyl-tripeptide--D-alanyl-D-alanine ligase
MSETDILYKRYLESTGVSTDTRTVAPGNIFFALKGPAHNANRFAVGALKKGAMLAVVDEEPYATGDDTMLVPDALAALQNLALHHRRQLSIPVLGITGSNGKTTTKELVRDVLSTKYKVLATRGNLNNHIGVPLTVLSITADIELAVVEMGANHVGEIAVLCSIALPTHGLITNIGKAHIGLFGGIEGIIKGKTELYQHLRASDGVVFVNQDQKVLLEKSEGMAQRHLYPHQDAYYHCSLEDTHPALKIRTEEGTLINTGLVGAYNFGNVSSALCIGKYFGIDPNAAAQAVASYIPENNRSQILNQNGVLVVLDAYNANPTSMAAAIESLWNMNDQKKAVILGDMYELGDTTEAEHRAIGKLLAEKRADRILLCGEFMEYAHQECPGSHYFANKSDLAAYLQSTSLRGYTVLVKGSRGMALEDLRPHIH